MRIITARILLAIIFAGALSLPNATAQAGGDDTIYAWYRADRGLQLDGPTIVGWKNDNADRRHITSSVGNPRAVRVETPRGVTTVARFDGKSKMWAIATPAAWGRLGGNRTIIAYVRLADTGSGFLFDGSTQNGLARAQIRGGSWQAGAQPRPISNANKADRPTLDATAGIWQAHAFVFHRDATRALTVRHMIIDANGLRSATAKAFAGPPQGGLCIGATGGHGVMHGLKGDVAEMLVISRAVGEQEFAKIAGVLRDRWGEPIDAKEQIAEVIQPDPPGMFRSVVRKQRDDGVHTYRIPGLATTPKGTLVAVFDARNARSADLPGDIDVGMMRSTDNGATWGPMTRIIDFPVDAPGKNGNGVGDPAVLVDEKTGAIFVIAMWSPGTRSWVGNVVSPDKTVQLVLTKSTDDGLTWSAPIDITPQVKNPVWANCFAGPGKGIQLRDGTLVFPAQCWDENNRICSFFIWSSHGGVTWKPSSIAVSPDFAWTGESQVAQLDDGSLLLSLRPQTRVKGQRIWARYEWSGDLANGKWGEPWLDLPDPRCQASLISHPSGALLFSNPAMPNQRRNMTVRASTDGGRTWNAGRRIDPRPSAYSCMTVLKDGSIGILYETGDTYLYSTLTFARFPLEWIMTAPPETPPKNAK